MLGGNKTQMEEGDRGAHRQLHVLAHKAECQEGQARISCGLGGLLASCLEANCLFGRCCRHLITWSAPAVAAPLSAPTTSARPSVPSTARKHGARARAGSCMTGQRSISVVACDPCHAHHVTGHGPGQIHATTTASLRRSGAWRDWPVPVDVFGCPADRQVYSSAEHMPSRLTNRHIIS